MTRNTIIGIGVAVIILVLAIVWLFLGRGRYQVSPSPTPAAEIEKGEIPTTPSPTPATQGAQPTEGVLVAITDAGFTPQTVKIKAGGAITWVNNTKREVQIGANPHPVHTGNREVSQDAYTLSLLPGDQKTVTIGKVGSFGFHDHLMPAFLGTVISE